MNESHTSTCTNAQTHTHTRTHKHTSRMHTRFHQVDWLTTCTFIGHLNFFLLTSVLFGHSVVLVAAEVTQHLVVAI